MIISTRPDAHHDRVHEFAFPDGVIPAGWYESNTVDGHTHGVHVEDDIDVGQTVVLRSSGGHGLDYATDEDRHVHELEVTAVEAQPEEEDAMRLEPMTLEELSARREAVETKRQIAGIVEVKQDTRNGVPVGIVAGYFSTWEADRGGIYGVPDQFVRGAWLESLADHRRRGGRAIRLKDHHGRTIGGIPIESVREDDVGLYGTGEINLETQAGRELYSLARQLVLSDFSVGYVAVNDDFRGGLRQISQAKLLEVSIVDEPANPNARILEVKSVVTFQDLPMASRERRWDAPSAMKRCRKMMDCEENPSRGYRRAFLWYDRDNAESFEAYKLPIADVVDGELMAVPRAIFAAAAALRGRRGGVRNVHTDVEIPASDRPRVIRHLERYYRKLDMDSPFQAEERALFVDVETARAATPEEIETKLMRSGVFSRGAAKVIASRIRSAEETKSADTLQAILDDLRAVGDHLAPR